MKKQQFNRDVEGARDELERIGIETFDSNGRNLFGMLLEGTDHASYYATSDMSIIGSEELQEIMRAYNMYWEWNNPEAASVYYAS